MSPEMALSGGGAVAVLLIAILSARRNYNAAVDTMACAAILAAGWAFVYIAQKLLPTPEPPPYTAPRYLPLASVVDAMGAIIVGVMAFTRKARWKFVLLCLFMAQLVLEVAFSLWTALHAEVSYGVLITRWWLSQGLYILQLICVGGVGLANVMGIGVVHPEPVHRGYSDRPPVGSG